MCGIYGKVRFDGRHADVLEAEQACTALRHRGPDDHGVYQKGGTCLGHARLSIIDLSPLGHQPMTNEDGSLWIVFNGEIYNFMELRLGLEAKGHRFRSRTDTEVVLHLYEELGAGCVDRLRGMFAFAIWDEKTRGLFLARDRVGKKPLYYSHRNEFLSFSSEVRPLAADPEIPTDVDPVAIHHYLTFQSVPNPFSAFRAIRKLPPAHWMMVRDGNVEIRRYWQLSYTPKFPSRSPEQRADLEDRLVEKIRDAVRVRLVSDVPLGALLSGGVDSSGVVALMSIASGEDPVRTFSVGFEEKEYDELGYARAVSERYRTDHKEFILRPNMTDVLPVLVEHFGEPFADPAALPLYFITRIAREYVKVALCGDGGDESFAGYHRHKLNLLLRGADRLPSRVTGRIASWLPAPGTSSSKSPLWVAKRLFQTLSLPPAIRNLRFFGHFDRETKELLYTRAFAERVADADTEELVLERFRETDADNLLDTILYSDIHTYLADTLLPKVDITSMANSLEMRSPLLDHEMMEFAARLPADMKIRRLETKHILKKVFGRFLPPGMLQRPKMGFGVPLDRWFRGELKQKAYDLILSERAIERGYFREGQLRRILDEHVQGKWNWQYQIYNLLMLELWHRRFTDR
ncbi:MAG TPA: asparagine synthase (glutamine-hydrolyzing) [Deltaproteobacteria bacterium]|nr:MAG: asparagine synthase (glutamine-hydrolyzing) [Deltaproteobacteria bacterium GWC2_65_14]HBO70208.1 asparagine synthase (glutamine-hydrolyzing) [Deltaproteobacteria bacterium]